MSSFGEADVFDYHDAKGFIIVVTLPTKIQNQQGILNKYFEYIVKKED